MDTGRRDLWLSVAGLTLLALAAVTAALLFPDVDIAAVRDRVRGSGPLAWATFLVLMVAVTQLPVPRTIWTVSAGVLFGPVTGSVLALAGMAASVTVALVLIRWVGGPAVRRAEQVPRFRALQETLAERGWVAVLGLRMIPVVPFSLLNYACALSRIRLSHCIGATVVGSAPLTVAVVVSAEAVVAGGNPWVLSLGAMLAVVGLLLTGWEARRIRAKVSAEAAPVKP